MSQVRTTTTATTTTTTTATYGDGDGGANDNDYKTINLSKVAAVKKNEELNTSAIAAVEAFGET